MKRCLIMPASFKGSLTSREAAFHLARGLHAAEPSRTIISVPLSDGGEGLIDTYITAFNGRKVALETTGPLGEPCLGYYGVIPPKTAVIELAVAAGLPMVKGHENPLNTTTYGVGLIIKRAYEDGFRDFLIGLGGSATHDGGAGIAAALGIVYKDAQGVPFVPTGGTLSKIVSIENHAPYVFTSFTVLCDVRNPLVGAQGAAAVYGPQKGATPAMVGLLDQGLAHYADILKKTFNCDCEFEGAGAAGGTALSLKAFFGAVLKRGIDAVLDAIDFPRLCQNVDLILTGEGRLDATSFQGKVIDGLCRRAEPLGIPVIAFVGHCQEDISAVFPPGLEAVISINPPDLPVAEAMAHAGSYLEQATEAYFRHKKRRE